MAATTIQTRRRQLSHLMAQEVACRGYDHQHTAPVVKRRYQPASGFITATAVLAATGSLIVMMSSSNHADDPRISAEASVSQTP